MASAKAAKYRGSIGRTRSEWVMYSHPEGERTMVEIYRSIDASTDPALARRLADPGSSQPINTAQLDERGPVRTIETPVVYHDPERPLLALVLPESYRHRELEARRDLLDALARDQEPVPDYAADFTTVFGSEGLARLLTEQQDREAELEKRAIRLRDDQDDVAQHRRSLETRAAELETRAATLSGREAELDRRLQEINDREHAISERSDSLARRAAAIEQRTMELAKQRAELHDRADRSRAAQAIEAAQAPATAVQPAKPAAAPAAAVEPGIQEPTVPTRRFEPEELSDDATSGDSVSRIRPGGAEVQVSVTNVALESDASPLQSETTQKRPRPDAALQKWLSSSDSVLAGKDPSGLTRFAIATDERTLTALQADHLQVKLQLHRQPAYPVPSLAVAPAGALEQEDSGVYWCFDFDIQEPAERALLEDLGRDFRFAIDLYSVDKEPVTRRIVTAEVADNVPYLLAAADAHLAAIDASTRSVARAKLALSAPAYDRFGLGHPERASFRDDRLRNLGRPIDVRRALSVARRFSKPEREKYLVLERGYSLSKWRSRRDRCIARAIELGLWIGPRLAQIAIAEGMEPSRSALVAKLLDNFSELTAGGAHGLDDVAVRENWEALREEASTLGLGRAGQRRSEPIHSEAEPAVSGTISAAAPVTTEEPATAPEAQTPSAVARLDDKDARLAAAIELAHEADPATLAPLFRAVEQMTRSEAGRVLGTIPAFGVAAVPHLVEGLRSRKGFIRQGCALGLGVIGGDDAIEALCDLLIDEPTDIWREVARAIGVLGGLAASALVARVRSKPDSVERAAWALANIQVVSDGARVVESLARGRDPVAANLAQRATELAKQARVEDATVRAQKPSRDVTVNRAFSQRFFEAMGGDAVPTAIPGLSRSAPAVRLDDADLLDARDLEEEEAEQLDESDLIPT